jgi:5-(carboxyamino)imidazole ribonucleotide mutase
MMSQPLVGIVMGSRTDLSEMEGAGKMLAEFNIPYEVHVMSAHRSPDKVVEYANGAEARGLKVLIAGAGGAAHLAGVIAGLTLLPVLGVPMQSSALGGLDSLLSIVQMPTGIPVATLAIGKSGAKNAALLAAQILALSDEAIRARVVEYRERRSEQSFEVISQ